MNRVYERRWIRFAKGDKMKYIGHLDLLRIFQSAIRRAKLPVAYSMGFNPHMRLSFALPLPVGMESICEYIELLLDEPTDLMPLDSQLPDGLRLLETFEIPADAPKPAAAIVAADYRLTFPGIMGVTEKHLQNILDASEIIIMKKTKKGEGEADIRPDIFALNHDGIGAVAMRLSAGSARNLSPLIVVRKIFEDMGISPAPHEISLLRQEVYGNGFSPLHEQALHQAAAD